MKLKIPPPVQALTLASIMWVLDFLIPATAVEIPGKVFIITLLVITGSLIDLAAIYAFARARTTVNPLKPDNASSLVATGIFKYSRNPMYLGILLLLSAWTLWLGNLLNLMVLFTFPLYITYFQIIPEEEVLARLFGEDFKLYCQKTRRWL